MELEISKSKDRSNNRNQRDSKKPTEANKNKSKEDEELASAIEKINEMERRNNARDANHNIFLNSSSMNNNLGFNIDSSDIINLNSFSDHPCNYLLIY